MFMYHQNTLKIISLQYVVMFAVPAIVEGYKKIRVAFFKINDWINDRICNLNLIFYRSNKYLGYNLFFL